MFLVPVLGLGLAAFTFGEQVGPLEGVGVVFTLASIGAVAWESQRVPAPPESAGSATGRS